MNSNGDSEDYKSNSGTSESELQNYRQKLNSFKYPPMPKRNDILRQEQNCNKILIITNLFEITFIDLIHKFSLYTVEILPEVDANNYSLKRQIYSNINLPNDFKKTFWAGNNLYAIIAEEKNKSYEKFIIKEEINNTNYNIALKKIKEVTFKQINGLNGANQKEKSIIENIFRNIIMRNPKVIKFHDRTIFEIDPKNIISVNSQNKQNIYKGYITSAQITENGLFIQINNRNKYISGKTALQKINEIKTKLSEQKKSPKDVKEKISEFFYVHRTVLTTYGSLRAYKIIEVNFDATPDNTSIKVKDSNGIKKNISIINYYKNQYNVNIKDKTQPLLIAENNFLNNKKLLPPNKSNKVPNENDNTIYLIPELVYITGIEEDDNKNNRRNNSRNIIEKTKTDPAKKMSEINGIFNLINSDDRKKIKKRNGNEIELKSPKELKEEWGIILGDNLTFQGRIIPQPKLNFKNEKTIIPKNGIFRSDKPYNCATITNDNIFYVFDKNERKSDHKQLFIDLMHKCRSKDFIFSNDFNPNKVYGYGLDNTYNWENIHKSLRNIDLKNGKCFGIILCSPQLEKFYDELKNFFIQQYKIPTQHIITRNIENPKRGNSIQFNVIDQINIKMGGKSFYIDFTKEGIIRQDEVFLIIGLDSKFANKKVTYSMTSTINQYLNNFVTQEKTCDDIAQEKNKTLTKMFEIAIDEINRRCPHSPDYIIIYRQGGNEVRNKRLTINELDNFTGILSKYREKYKDNKNFNFRNTKLYYICCNLKSDLKFFETETKGVAKAYYNPKSGLIVDDNVTQKSKYEFYLQPQFVNQGTATPCHYQIMYYDKSEKEEDEFTIEQLEKLSFYMSFYYWTWAGAIRTPSLLKMSSTAMTFYSKVLNSKEYCFFEKPTYI